MIVSCPSCDSKYQVADEKVAGNVLRTRCKACGSQILVDGTIPPGPNNEEEDDVTRIMRPEDRPDLGESHPPASGNRWTVNVGDDTRPMTASEIVQAVVNGSLGDGVSVWKSGMANWASIADVPELATAIEQTGRRPRPKSGSTKPPPPARGAAVSASNRTATGPSNGPTRTSKPPPPARAAATGTPGFKSPAVKASPVVAISKQIENQKDALDPSASTGDFYSKLLNKVGSKSKSAPPAAQAEVKPANRPRATMPPPSPAVGSRNSPGRTSTIKKEPPVANVPSNLDPDAAPSDFYGKLLAKVRPQTSDPAPPATADARMPGSGRTTLTPPTWGAIANPSSENYAQSHPAARVPASAQPAASSPIRVLGSSEAQAESAAGAIDIPINIDADEAENESKGAPAAAPVVIRRSSPTPPKRPDPVIPVDIQLPPMDGAADARAAGGPTVVLAKSTPPPAAEPKVEGKPETLIKPATEIVTDSTSPGLRARPGRRKGGGIIAILMVGLLCAGGGVAATVYMLKKQENKNAGPALPSASQAAPQANNAPAQASGGQPQATPPPTGTGEAFDADELARTGAPGAQAMRGAVGKRSAKAGAGETAAAYAADAPAAASAASKPAAGAIDPTLPGWLEASVKSKADKAAAAKAAAPEKPEKPEKPAAPAKPSGPAFNRDAAMAVLGIAASQAPSCKRPGGPTGNGKALVTFDTDGQVVIANIVGEGISGTPVARCVAGIFQRIKVAPFTGDRATVSKAFTIPP